jgi:predicted MFS family arabinose efflux permease
MILNYIFLGLAIFIFGKTFINLFISWRSNRTFTKKPFHAIELVRPLIFIKLFANCLSVVFFPQFLLKITIASGMPQSAASLLYATYQIIFILMIIPGGFLVEVKNLKRLLIITTFFESLVFLGLAFAYLFWQILLLQAAFGLLIPISSATEYAYIFKLSSKKERAHAIALYSNTLRGAMIAGIFTGGMLVNHLGIRGIFLTASCIVFLSIFYITLLVPKIKPKYDIRIKKIPVQQFTFKFVLKNSPLVLKNLNLLKTILLVGLPFGLFEEGIILFSLPLILSHYQISHDQIGQLLVLFSIGFFITNKYIAKKTDKLLAETYFIFFGLLGIALSLLLISHFNLKIYIIGIFLFGIFRGFIFSPTISYVSKTAVAESLGKNVTYSFYKLAETLGRIIGPILIMQLLLFFNYSSISYAIMGALFTLIAGLFLFI